MASLAMTLVDEAAKKLPLHQAISGIFGSISMAAWICVIVRIASTDFFFFSALQETQYTNSRFCSCPR
jgi:hypothetical protein